jgi:hypothetical protein
MRVLMITTGGIASYLYLRPTCPTSYVVVPLSESWRDQRYPSLNRWVVSLRVLFGTDSVASISGRRDSWEYGIVSSPGACLPIGTQQLSHTRAFRRCSESGFIEKIWTRTRDREASQVEVVESHSWVMSCLIKTPYSGVVLSCQCGLCLSQAMIVRHWSGRAVSTSENYAWLEINVSLRFVGVDCLAPIQLGLAFYKQASEC